MEDFRLTKMIVLEKREAMLRSDVNKLRKQLAEHELAIGRLSEIIAAIAEKMSKESE